MKNLLLIFTLLLSCNILLQGQGDPDCGGEPECSLEEIDNAEFPNPPLDPNNPNYGDDFCNGGAIHNAVWFPFVAGHTDMDIVISSSGCVLPPGSPCGDAGLQIAIWADCSGTCIAGDAACIDTLTTVTFNVTDLNVGEIYYVIVDGCCGTECSMIELDAAPGGGGSWVFDIPTCDEMELKTRWKDPFCSTALPVGVYCVGPTVVIEADGDNGTNALDDVGAQWSWNVTGPAEVQWEESLTGESGSGGAIEYGDFTPGETGGGNKIDVVFDAPGTYTFCVEDVLTFCDMNSGCDGSTCIEVEVVDLEPQDFGSHRLCYLAMADGFVFEPPVFTDPATGIEFQWDNGDGGIGFGDLTEVADPIYMAEVDISDDCGCPIQQFIEIELVGPREPENVELFLLQCQINAEYEFLDELIGDFGDFGCETYPEFSLVRDDRPENCDSIICLQVFEIELGDSLIVGACGPNGVEVTLDMWNETTGDDFDLEDDLMDASFEWKDSITNMDVGMGVTVTLDPGRTYCVEIRGVVIDDYTQTETDCEMMFCYPIEGATVAPPVVLPYDDVLCDDETTDLTVGVQNDPAVTYEWAVPPGYSVNGGTTSSTIDFDITDYNPNDTLRLTVVSECGGSDLDFPITVAELPQIMITYPTMGCVGDDLTIEYTGSTAGIDNYLWSVSGGVINGNNNGTSISVTPSSVGSMMFTLEISNAADCMDSQMLTVDIDMELGDPVIDCDTSSDEIIFTWEEVSGASGYAISEDDIPAGATVTTNGNMVTVTDISPGDMATITVEVLGSMCGNPQATETCTADNCNVPPATANSFADLDFCLPYNGQPIQFDAEAPAGYAGTYTGPGITPAGLFDPNDPALSMGGNVLSFEYTDGNCSDDISIVVTLNDNLSPTITLSANEVCLGDGITASLSNAYAMVSWDFGMAGDFTGDENNLTYSTSGTKMIGVMVTDANGCTGEAMASLEVFDPLPPLIVNCTQTTDAVFFSWTEIAGADSYEITVDDPNQGTLNLNQTTDDFTYDATGLSQGQTVTITVTAVSPNICDSPSAMATCTAEQCDNPAIEFAAPMQTFCSSDMSTVNLEVTVDGAEPEPGSGNFVGDGITLIDASTALFDPMGLAPGTITVTYTYTNPNNGCTESADFDFEIIAVSQPNLATSTTTVCVGEDVVLDYNVQSVPGGSLVWELDGGMDSSPQTQTTRTVSWASANTYEVMLSYTVPPCQPSTTSIFVDVVDSIPNINLRCANTGEDFIEWQWDGNTAVDYEIYVDGMLVETINTTEYRIDDLSLGQDVTLRVVGKNAVCGDKEEEIMCNSTPCIPPLWTDNIDEVYCYSAGDPGVTLDVSVFDPITGLTEPAVFDSPFVTGGVFTPEAGSSQEYTIQATCETCICMQDTFIRVQVYDNPEFSLSASELIICEGSSTTIDFDWVGSGGTISYNWNFAGGVSASPMDGPQEVTFASSGTYNATLMIDNNGCVSEMRNIEILVEPEPAAPVIQCTNSTITSVEFGWSMVDCADRYNVVVTVDGAVVDEQEVTGTTFEVADLTSEQDVELVVTALSSPTCPCGDVSSSPFVCTSEPCPQVDFDFSRDEGESICQDETAAPFTISATPQGLPGNGTGTWSGDPISDGSTGTVDPSMVGAGTYDLTYTYTEGVCNYTAMTSVTFIEPPMVTVVSLEDPSCPGDAEGIITVDGLGGATPYMFSLDGGALQSSGMFSNVSVGGHSVQVVDANGCLSATESLTLSAPSAPMVTITGDAVVILENDGTYNLNLNGTLDENDIDDVSWTYTEADGNVVPGSGLTFTYLGSVNQQDGTLQAVITYNGDCQVVTDVFNVDIKQIQSFYVPNTVSLLDADGSGNNEWRMFIKGDEVFPKNVKIYNRWGNLVNETIWNFDATNRPPVGDGGLLIWDGLYGENGPELKTGVYVYILEIEQEGITRQVAGDITIIR